MSSSRPTKMPCKIMYRRCVFSDGDTGANLQDLISRALSKQEQGVKLRDAWTLRLQTLSADDEPAEFYFINHVRGHTRVGTNNIFGDLCRYQAGSQQAIIDQVDGAPELAVTLLPPKDRQEFLNGMLWWRVSGNHILAVQGRSVRWKMLEAYLRWLLTERTDLVAAETMIELLPGVTPTHTSQNTALVQSLVVSGALSVHEARTTDDVPAIRRSEARRSAEAIPTTRGRLWQALSAVMPDSNKLRRLMEQLPDDEELKLEVTIKFPGKRSAARPLSLGSVQNAVDALDDANITVNTDQGPIRLGELLQYPEHVVRIDSHGGIWDREDVYIAFGEAWHRLQQQGFITA